MKSLKEIKAQLPKKRRVQIENRAQELIAGERILRALREQHQMTQVNLSKILEMDQSAISRLESRHDFLLSTLNAYIRALGGELEIYARFPDSQPVDLTEILSSKPQKT